MTWWQHERLHDELDHDAYHDRLEHRQYEYFSPYPVYQSYYYPPYPGYGFGFQGRNYSLYFGR